MWSDGRTRAAINQTTGIQNLDLPAFLNQRISCPPLQTQRAIADYLDRETARIDGLIAAKQRLVDLLDERDQAILSNLVVPTDCKQTHLRYFATIQGGLTVDASRNSGEDSVTLPYLRVANVQAGHLDLTDITEITVPRALAARSMLRKNDVLMTEGGDIDKLGRGTVWTGALANCLHQNHIFAVRPHPLRLDPWYLSLLTQSCHGRHYFESTGVQSTNLASTSSAKILTLPIPVIPLGGQEDIVAEWKRLSSLTGRMRAALTQQLGFLQERRQALITAAVTGQLDIPEAA
jgi:type I restriction enzyme S subunit